MERHTIRAFVLACVILSVVPKFANAQLSIVKTFSPTDIPRGTATTVSFSLTNSDTHDLTNLTFTDQFPAGLQVNAASVSNGCLPGIVPIVSANAVMVSGGTLPANTNCTISYSVTGVTEGTQTNPPFPASALDQATTVNITTNAATVTVEAPPVLTKQFNCVSGDTLCTPDPSNPPVAKFVASNGGTVHVQYSITNPGTNPDPANGVVLTDSFSPQLVPVSGSQTTSNCPSGSSFTILNSSTLQFNTTNLPIGSTCVVTITLTGTSTPGSEFCGSVPDTAQIRSSNGQAGANASASVQLICPPALQKNFTPSSVNFNGTSTLTLTLNNPNASAGETLTSVGFTDALPTGVTGSSTITQGCPSHPISCSLNTSYTSGTNTITVTGATLTPNQSCCVNVLVTGTGFGRHINTTTAPTSNEAGSGGAASADLFVGQAPIITKTFGSATVTQGGTTSVTIDIKNPNTDLTNGSITVNLSDTFPAGIGPSGPASPATCGFSNTPIVVTTGPGGTITLTGAMLAPSPMGGPSVASFSECTFTVPVAATATAVCTPPGSPGLSNTASATSTYGPASSTATIGVTCPNLTITKSFSPTTVLPGGQTTVSFTINNSGNVTETGLAFTDTFPTNFTSPSIPSTSACNGGTYTVTAPSTLTFSGGSLTAGQSCTISVVLTANATAPGGPVCDTTSGLTSTPPVTPPPTGSACVTVTAPGLTVTKAFTPNTVAPGGTTTVSFTLMNTGSVALSGLSFTDIFPTNFTSPSIPSTSACNGGSYTVTAPSTLSFSGGSLAIGQSCTISVLLTASAAAPGGQVCDTTSGVTSTPPITPAPTGTGCVTVNPPPPTLTITKAFSTGFVVPGGTTTVIFTINNTSTVTQTNIAFTDQLPPHLTTPDIAATAACNGGSYTVTSNFLTFTGGSLPGGGTCSISVVLTADASVTTPTRVCDTTSTVTSTQGMGDPSTACITVGPGPLPTFNSFLVKIFPNLGAGDSVINIGNTGSDAAGTNPFSIGGNLCVNVYAFSPDEQEVACCTCFVTPNGVETTSARQLISKTLTPAVPTSITVKLLANNGSTCNAATVSAANLAQGLIAFGTNLHLAAVGGSTHASTYAVTETPFIPSTLSAAELARITTLCGFIQANGSGFGVCPGCTVGAAGAVRQ